ncbi:MAG: 50S ribosomal protein L20 [Myxococcota bacterium]|nr:50S ribosomal protein L20 [Myxococcota bacterium]
MARIKRAQIRKKSTQKLKARSKGFFQGRGNQRRQAMEAVTKARTNSYIGRKQRKRQFRALWISRISAASKLNGMSYSTFMHGLSLAGIEINRKMLSEIAIHDEATFASFVAKAKAAREAAA